MNLASELEMLCSVGNESLWLDHMLLVVSGHDTLFTEHTRSLAVFCAALDRAVSHWEHFIHKMISRNKHVDMALFSQWNRTRGVDDFQKFT